MNPSSTPLVSIAMCTFNGAEYIREQIESILRQTYRNLEIVVVDDASTDHTAEIIRSYQRQDDRLRLQINAETLGYNRNFEKAISLCTAEFIAVSDQDDIWESRKIEVMMAEWPQDAPFIFSLSGSFSEPGMSDRKEAPKVYYHDIRDIRHLVFNSPVHGHAVMFRKELINHCTPFPPDVFYDWWISMHAASLGYIGCIPQTLTWHRIHIKNSSRTLTSISNKGERERQLREQCAFFIERFIETPVGNHEEKRSLLEYAQILRELDGKKFSWKMFWFAWRNRNAIFHYKRKPFLFFSHLKHAYRMGYKGLL